MKISGFSTLTEAKEYKEVTDKKQVGSGQARGFLISEGVWTRLRTIQADLSNALSSLADGVIVTASDASSFFGLDTATAEGRGNIASVGVLVSAGILTQTQADTFLGLAITIKTPYADTTQAEFDARDIEEVLSVTNPSLAQHILTLSITTQPSNSITVKVQQRFGPNNSDLTIWHDCAQFSGVNFTQQTYKSQITASPAAYRELRAVSDQTIGMSIV